MQLSVSNPARCCLIAMLGTPCLASAEPPPVGAIPLAPAGCPHDDSGLKLSPGFCATVFADAIGHARHLVVSPAGVVYVNTWSGRYYGTAAPPAGGFLVALQ